ncbi:hypothetical protein FSP39_022414 [Pinctada imbricata]|uniref:Chitin-binding type-2 domain-containing protein n=1 Tax=Pinctada imbricata TaxID=66713 RepID=A0AA89C8I0_PINIB|nr:hypothetical protein FSP39_022414 [Pinctada imbricata]
MMSFRQVFLLPVLFICCFVGNNASKACTGVVGTKWQPDRTDCSYFHLCRGGNGVRLPCPWNTVTNAQLEACVPKGSKMDTCELNGNCQSGQQSCRGRPDGLNPWRLNFISSSFVICANQHVVYKGTCPSNVTVTVFDPARRMCTELKMNAGRF